MAEENKHAILSASASHRWLECTPSARLEQEFSEQSTIASKEGTAAHELGAHKIMRKLCMESERPVSEFNNDEMEAYTEDYADFVVENYERAKRHYKDAQIFIEIQKEFGSFDDYIWSFTDGEIIKAEYKTESELSKSISKDLKKRGMKFVGPTIIYSYLESIGVIDNHEKDCFKF